MQAAADAPRPPWKHWDFILLDIQEQKDLSTFLLLTKVQDSRYEKQIKSNKI